MPLTKWSVILSLLAGLGGDIIGYLLMVVFVSVLTRLMTKYFKDKLVYGKFLDEAFLLLIESFEILFPFYIAGVYFTLQQPIFSLIINFVFELTGVQNEVWAWLKVYLILLVFAGIFRILIEIFLRFIRKIFGGFFTEILCRFTKLISIWISRTAPIFFLVLLGIGKYGLVSEPYKGFAYTSPIIAPSEVSSEVWSIIVEGTQRAQRNGYDCDPYLLASIKIYETGGSNACDVIGSAGCVSSAGALGIFQFIPETFNRNAQRHSVAGDYWDPVVATEVACYTIADEVNLSLNQKREDFIAEFSEIGFVWNYDASGAGKVYDRAILMRQKSLEQHKVATSVDVGKRGGYSPPGENLHVRHVWGEQMFYGSSHNGIDWYNSNGTDFVARAVDDGVAVIKYWDDCNLGVVTLQTQREVFYYVHMDINRSLIAVNTPVQVKKGDPLGWIHEGQTTCSGDSHLHLMRADGSYIGEEEFK